MSKYLCSCFIPSSPNSIINANDGGLFISDNYLAEDVEWNSLNNGYYSTQLYTATINEHQATNSILGGFQDNGNFFTNSKHLEELKKENLIAFKYCDEKGNINENSNPNGSLENIAGILNEHGNVLGMMPHPERVCDNLIGGEDGNYIWESVLKSVKK